MNDRIDARDATEWDVICVGAGLTSLVFAARLVQEHPGVRVLVLDKHSIPGGYATWFRRPKQAAHFDCSLHKLSGMGSIGNLRRILRRLELDGRLTFFPADHFFCGVTGDRRIFLTNDATAAKQELIDAFPEEAAGIDCFLEDVATHGKNGYFQYQMMEGEYEPDFKQLRYAHRNFKTRTVASKFDELFQSDALKEILSAPAIYIGAFPEQISYLYYLHVVYATLCAGSFHMAGSAQQLSDSLAERIRTAGGKVVLSNPVRRVLVNDAGEVTGVEAKSGMFHASQVYVNAAPQYVVDHLLPPLSALERIKEKLSNLAASNSTTTLYIVTDRPPEEIGIAAVETMIFADGQRLGIHWRREAATDLGAMERAYWDFGTMEVTNYHAANPAGGFVVVANVLDSIRHWPERRSSSYKPKKARAKERLMARLFQAFPGLQSAVRYDEMSTPRTYLRYTNNIDGAGYGALVGTDLSSHGFHYDFPIKGVRFLSSWVAGPGYEAAFGYGDMMAKRWRWDRTKVPMADQPCAAAMS